MKLLLKYPTRARPYLFKDTLSKYQKMLSGKHEYHFLISMDKDDQSMQSHEMSTFLDAQPNISYHYGNSKTKVQAINADMEHAGNFDILLLISDDMIPVIQGYDEIICTEMQTHFPDLTGCLHFHDNRVGRVLNTLSIMGKKMYDNFGYIYHPAYNSLWVDNEFTDVTNMMNKTIYIEKCIIHHQWTDITGKDTLHYRNENYYEIDKAIYLNRKANGFPK